MLRLKLKAAIISLGSESSEWTVNAMKKYFEEVDDIDIRKIEINISGRAAEILYEGKPLKEFDCVYVKGSFRYAQLLQTLTSLLEKKCFMPISADAFTIAHDKLLTHLELQKSNIPMPKTYVSATVGAAKKILEKINFPVMMKFPHGTGGKGVMFADSYASASSLLDALATLRQPFIIQEFIETGGTDIRAIVVGNKVVASMRRKASSMEARANFHSGGTGEPVELDALTKKIAVDVARAIRSEICAVDILESVKGPLIVEANISPGLQLISSTTKIDVADNIAKFLYDRTTEMKLKRHGVEATRMIKNIEHDKNGENAKQIITTLNFRGDCVLLPEMITKASKLTLNDDYEITAEPDKITIKKLKINKE